MTRNIPTDAVTVAGTKFKPPPHEYVIRPPFGDGATKYPTREAAMQAIREDDMTP